MIERPEVRTPASALTDRGDGRQTVRNADVDQSTESNGFAARYVGRCAVCDDTFDVGVQITKTPHGYTHVHCPEDRPTRPVCGTCWMEQPCPCQDGL